MPKVADLPSFTIDFIGSFNSELELENHEIIVRIAHSDDGHYAETITEEMAASAAARGTGIAKRSPEYIRTKMDEGKAVIALTPAGDWVGFCYIEAWGHGEFVANSGLVVNPAFRGSGVATRIKKEVFELSRHKYPEAKIFGLTTGLAVMKINSELGYKPVTYSELTDDNEFWKGCQSCVNYDILMSKNRKNCLCTGMLYDPAWEKEKAADEAPVADAAAAAPATEGPAGGGPEVGASRHKHAGGPEPHEAHFGRRRRMHEIRDHLKLYERWLRFKKYALLRGAKDEPAKKEEQGATGVKKFFHFFF
jgi:hypothetical protein